MTELSVSLPDAISKAEARMCLATRLYETGRLSLGQATELADCSKREFMDLLAKQGTDLFTYDPSELTRDLIHA